MGLLVRIVILLLIVLSIVYTVSSFVARLTGLARPRGGRSPREQIAVLIEDFVRGRAEPYRWDEFCKTPLADPELEKIRQRCSSIARECPPEGPGQFTSEVGLQILRSCARELRSGRRS